MEGAPPKHARVFALFSYKISLKALHKGGSFQPDIIIELFSHQYVPADYRCNGGLGIGLFERCRSPTRNDDVVKSYDKSMPIGKLHRAQVGVP